MSSVRMCSDVLHIYTMLCNGLWTEVFVNSFLNLKAGINAYFVCVCKANL